VPRMRLQRMQEQSFANENILTKAAQKMPLRR
jgi:hypothetical protein